MPCRALLGRGWLMIVRKESTYLPTCPLRKAKATEIQGPRGGGAGIVGCFVRFHSPPPRCPPPFFQYEMGGGLKMGECNEMQVHDFASGRE